MTEETKAPKAKTVIDDMAARFTAPDLEQGIAYLQRVSGEYADFASYPLVAVGMDSEGNFDPAVYTDSTRMMVAKLRKSEGKGDDRTTTIKAIVVGAVPTLDALLASDSGKEWVQRIIDKELNHVLVRPLRDAENVLASVSEMPSTLEAFISSGGAGGSTGGSTGATGSSAAATASSSSACASVAAHCARSVAATAARRSISDTQEPPCVRSQLVTVTVWPDLGACDP